MPQQNNSPEVNKQIVRRFVEECWNQGSLNKASELLTDQVRFHDPVFPNMNPGIQNIKNHIETSRKAFPDLKFTIDDTIAERNEVVVHWTAHGTHKGPFLGMEPTNRKATVDVHLPARRFKDRRSSCELEPRDDDGATRSHRSSQRIKDRCKARAETGSKIASLIELFSVSVNCGGPNANLGTPM